MIYNIKEIIKKNNKIYKIKKYFDYILYRYLYSDEYIIRKDFKKIIGRNLNLSNPIKYNDKIQWLKLYWRD